jgi:hypothetical protein
MSFGGSFAYHETCPDGRIFKDEDEYIAHIAAGWVEAPWLVSDDKQEGDVMTIPPKTERRPPGRPSKKTNGGK